MFCSFQDHSSFFDDETVALRVIKYQDLYGVVNIDAVLVGY
jgi:hypothetical protein